MQSIPCETYKSLFQLGLLLIHSDFQLSMCFIHISPMDPSTFLDPIFTTSHFFTHRIEPRTLVLVLKHFTTEPRRLPYRFYYIQFHAATCIVKFMHVCILIEEKPSSINVYINYLGNYII